MTSKDVSRSKRVNMDLFMVYFEIRHVGLYTCTCIGLTETCNDLC